MAVEKSRIVHIIRDAVAELNESLASEKRLTPTDDTILMGAPSKLTSLDLVNLIVITEQKLADEMNVAISLADEKAMSQKNSPFRSVEALANYVVLLLGEQRG